MSRSYSVDADDVKLILCRYRRNTNLAKLWFECLDTNHQTILGLIWVGIVYSRVAVVVQAATENNLKWGAHKIMHQIEKVKFALKL